MGPACSTRALPRNAENPSPFAATRSAFRDLPDGDTASFIVPDPAHTYAIAGWGKDFLGSSILLLLHMQVWGPGTIQVQLNRAWELFKDWCKANHRTTSMTYFKLKTFKVASLLNSSSRIFAGSDIYTKMYLGSIESRRYTKPNPIIVEPRKLEHGFRRIRARIPYTLP